jgi:hypothetical protein
VLAPKPVVVVPAEPEFTETPAAPSLLPWRRQLAGWPDEWRERWGVRANALEDEGLAWRDAEQQAFIETLKAKREAAEAKPIVELKTRRIERALFKESA